jgi:predicted nucleic acid-binding protein
MSTPPSWLAVCEAPRDQFDDGSVEGLDEGEIAAIALATSLPADLLLMDDRRGVMVARRKGLRVTGTLGVLDVAAERGLVDFAEESGVFGAQVFKFPKRFSIRC